MTAFLIGAVVGAVIALVIANNIHSKKVAGIVADYEAKLKAKI